MKKTIFTLLISFTLLLSACGESPATTIQPGILNPQMPNSTTNPFAGLDAIEQALISTGKDVSLQVLKELDPSLVQNNPELLIGFYPKAIAVSSSNPGFGPEDAIAVLIVGTVTYYLVAYYIDFMPTPTWSLPVSDWTYFESRVELTSVADVGTYMESHSHDDHNPNKIISKAHTIWLPALILGITTTGGQFDPNKFKCGVIKLGGKVVRAAIWMATDQFAPEVFGAGIPGVSASYKVGVSSDPWVGAYPKSSADFDSYQPSSAETTKGWSWEPKDCNDPTFPSPPTMLNAAQ